MAETKPIVLTDAHLPALAKGLVPFLREVLAPLVARIDALEQISDPTMFTKRLRQAEDEMLLAVKNVLRAEADDVRDRLADLEGSQLRDGGTWNAKTLFKPNQVVTCDGTLWLCKQPNSNSHPPGECWRLLVKTKGRV